MGEPRREAGLAPVALHVVASSSSTKKAAKLAQKGKGRKVRFQGGTVFPAAVALTLILGIALIVYSRQTLPAADDSPPTVNDHWHAAYGFYICDTWYELSGDLEQQGTTGYLNFARTGIHSHDDGVIHWHPFTSAAVGDNAVLGVFLDNYDVEITNDSLKFPDGQSIGFASEYVEGETQCNGEDAEVSVKAWANYTDTDNGSRYIANMDRVHLDADGMVFGIYFTPRDADQPMPPVASQLPELGAIDSNQVRPDDLIQPAGSTVPGATLPSGSTPGVTTPAAGTVAATVPDATAPAASAPATTLG